MCLLEQHICWFDIRRLVLCRPVAAKALKDGEQTIGSQLSSAAAPQPGDITEEMDWEVEHGFVDESYLQVCM